MLVSKVQMLLFRRVSALLFFLLVAANAWAVFYHGDDEAIRYTGRVQQLSGKTRLWSPGAYLELVFSGDSCQVILSDELRYNVQHNYIEIQLDSETPIRLRLQTRMDSITLIPVSKKKDHKLLVVKNTEASIRFIDMVAIMATSISPSKNDRKYLFEFIKLRTDHIITVRC